MKVAGKYLNGATFQTDQTWEIFGRFSWAGHETFSTTSYFYHYLLIVLNHHSKTHYKEISLTSYTQMIIKYIQIFPDDYSAHTVLFCAFCQQQIWHMTTWQGIWNMTTWQRKAMLVLYLSEEYHVHQLAQTQYKCLLLISIVKMTT